MSISGEPTRDLDSGSSSSKQEDDKASKLEAFRQHLKSCTWRRPCGNRPWHGFDISGHQDSYMEEMHKHKQAILARSLRKLNQNRLSTGYTPCNTHASKQQSGTGKDVSRQPGRKGRSGRKGKGRSSRKGGGDAKKHTAVGELLVMEKQNRVIKLSNVKLTQKACVGTLQVHVNGFQFTADDSIFHLHCLFKDIKASFFTLGDDTNLPLVHIHLDTDNEVKKLMPKDIQFHLLMTSDPEKQQKHKDRNTDLEQFAYWVGRKFIGTGLLPMQKFYGKDSFRVFFHREYASLQLAFFSMVVSVPSNKTFFVVHQRDIEIVNFQRCYHPCIPLDMIEMTVVCNDFKIDSMLKIHIFRESFHDIKNWLHRGNLKYYVNNVGNWKSRVKEIAEDFQIFLRQGGWDQFELEDDITIRDYYSMKSDSDYSSDTNCCDDSCSESDTSEEG